jgi:hypothetical protein
MDDVAGAPRRARPDAPSLGRTRGSGGRSRGQPTPGVGRGRGPSPLSRTSCCGGRTTADLHHVGIVWNPEGGQPVRQRQQRPGHRKTSGPAAPAAGQHPGQALCRAIRSALNKVSYSWTVNTVHSMYPSSVWSTTAGRLRRRTTLTWATVRTTSASTTNFRNFLENWGSTRWSHRFSMKPLEPGSSGGRAVVSACTALGAESSALGCSERAKLNPAPATRHDPRNAGRATNACHDGVPGRGSLRRRRQGLRQPGQGSSLRVARPAKCSTGGLRVTQGRVRGDHRAGSSPNQTPRPLQPVRMPITGGGHAMGAINVQTQMLAAPTAVMAEQAFGGLVEHPEQPMTIDVSNPGYDHNALTTPHRHLLSKSITGSAGRSRPAHDNQRPRDAGAI